MFLRANVHLLLIIFCVFATTCNYGFAGPSDKGSSPLTRWIHLHRLIYDADPNVNIELPQLISILNEMSAIEQSDVFKIGLKSVDELLGYEIKHFKELVRKYYEVNLLSNEDATITDLLLQTFDHESNDCTEKYFKELDEIYWNFRSIPMTRALQENRKLQYRNCWSRYMQSVTGVCKLLGSRIRNSLDELVTNIHTNRPNEPMELSSNSSSAVYHKESIEIARKIGQFLMIKAKQEQKIATLQYANDKFERLVKYPCKILLDETKQIMMKVFAMLGYSGNEDFISANDALILNRFLFCYRIESDANFISSIIAEFIRNGHSNQDILNLQMISSSVGHNIDERYNQQDLDPSSHLSACFPSEIGSTSVVNNDGECDFNLITQDIPLNEHISSELPQNQQLSLNPHNSTPLASPIIESEQNAMNNNNMRRVIRIDKGNIRGVYHKYPVHWSDGSITYETKSYLLLHWPDRLSALYKKMRFEKRNRHKNRKLAMQNKNNDNNNNGKNNYENNDNNPGNSNDLDTIQEDLEEEPSDKRARIEHEQAETNSYSGSDRKGAVKVVRIEFASGRGPNIRYRTTWSDGTTTLESKNFLVENCHELWVAYQRSLMEVRRERYETRLAEDLVQKRTKRTNIPYLARLNPVQQSQVAQVDSSSPRAHDIQDTISFVELLQSNISNNQDETSNSAPNDQNLAQHEQIQPLDLLSSFPRDDDDNDNRTNDKANESPPETRFTRQYKRRRDL